MEEEEEEMGEGQALVQLLRMKGGQVIIIIIPVIIVSIIIVTIIIVTVVITMQCSVHQWCGAIIAPLRKKDGAVMGSM